MRRAVDISKAMGAWRERYPDRYERTAALRAELRSCRASGRYPITQKVLVEMLELEAMKG